jgi:hypothetical protein
MCVLPPGYTYYETCPRCRGEGTVTCETCHGSGKCWVCGGDGVRDSLPPGMQWCPACQGTGECYSCGGKGWHVCEKCGGSGFLTYWMYNLVGATVVPFAYQRPLAFGIIHLQWSDACFLSEFQ